MEQEQELLDNLMAEPRGMTIVDALAEVASGNPDLVNRETYLSRLGICGACEQKVKVLNICGKCKCVIPLKAKFQRATCPIGRW